MTANKGKQLLILLYKNWLFTIRNWVASIAQLILPVFFILLVFVAGFLPSRLSNILHPPPKAISSLPQCTGWNGHGCQTLEIATANITFAGLASQSLERFTEQSSLDCVEKILTQFAQEEGLSYEINDTSTEIMWTETKNPTDYFLSTTSKSNYTQAIVVFLKCDLGNGDPSQARLNYDIIYNSSRAFSFSQIFFGSLNKPDGRKEIQVGIDRVFMSLSLNQSIDLSVSSQDYPTIYKSMSTDDRQAGLITLFVYFGIAFQFVTLLYNIVSEKDLKLRQGLKLIGLKDSVYWLSWTTTGLIFGLLATLLVQATGFATQLKFFTNTDFYITFVLLFSYSICLVALAMFFSVLISTTTQAVVAGVVFFVVGTLFIVFVGNSFVIEQLFYNIPQVAYALCILPPFPLAKAMSDIAAASKDTDTYGRPRAPQRFDTGAFVDFKNTSVLNLGAGSTEHFIMPATVLSVVFLIVDAIIFGVLAWYLDGVFPGNHGIPRKWYFPFDPRYWWTWRKAQSPVTEEGDDHQRARTPPTSNESTPLISDSSKLLASSVGSITSLPPTSPLVVSKLKKNFTSFLCGKKKCAVNGLSLACGKDEIFVLLGHNGAGKSTTINMLTGLLSPSSGDATFFGLSVKKDMDSIRNILGVCPQHNILWDDLTAREHMRMFAVLKGMGKVARKVEVEELLQNVQLDTVADQKVSTYSGGMKRRLSVALAFIGNPKVVFLDEPTTGMDPKIRREIWNLVLRMKGDRLIIMTTHSMEEADILGDNIAIMSDGALRDMGTSVYLKNKYAGYTVELVVNPSAQTEIVEIVQSMLKGATLKNVPMEIEGGVLYQYRFPPENRPEIPKFFKVIESKKDKVYSFSISQTTLEEVFLLVSGGTTAVSL